MNKIALITGATSGIGKASAIALAKENYNLILTGRRTLLLDSLKKELLQKYPVEIIVLEMDIMNTADTIEKINHLNTSWRNIDLLINSAGLAAGLDHFQDADFADWELMIDTNIRGLLAVSQPVSKFMVNNKKGHIINISSIAGTQTYEKGNVYCATKHAVEAISKSMRIDLLKHGIRVTTISPGAVETEFSLIRFKNDATKAAQVYDGYEPLTPAAVADAIIYAATSPANVNINYIELTPKSQANAFYLNRQTQSL
jgi:3-hydroxy acid dehydrogenase/malonic semialdehyde reductase